MKLINKHKHISMSIYVSVYVYVCEYVCVCVIESEYIERKKWNVMQICKWTNLIEKLFFFYNFRIKSIQAGSIHNIYELLLNNLHNYLNFKLNICIINA